MTARSFGQVRSRRAHVLRGVSLAIAGAIGIAIVGIAPLPAHATPQPSTAHDAAALMAARAHELEAVTEQFNTARVELGAQQAAAKEAADTLAQAQASLATARAQVRGIARSAFTSGGNTALQALLTSGSKDDFIERMSALDLVTSHQTAILEQAATAQQTAAQASADAQQATAKAQATYDAVLSQQKRLQAQITQYQALFNRLSAQERQAAISYGEGAGRASRAERTAPAAPVGPVVAGSRAAQIAVDTALAQRGKPYVWAAAGPSTFDCSGLVLYAYAAAGISLPHSSAMQARMGRPVSRSELQPGDLIGYYSPVSHIALYIGNGQVVQAPTAGDVVKISNMDSIGNITAMRRLAG